MFDEKLFRYDEEEHKGYYDNELVPSVTQLLEILYPLNQDIPQDRLENASKRGTKQHSDIELINRQFDNPLSFDTNLYESVSIAMKSGKQHLLDYVEFLSAYKLRPYDYENLIFLLDENNELICYGHYDCVYQATQDITFGDKVLFMQDRLYMCDYKTTSVFAKKKTRLQESIYALAYEQCSKNYIDNTFGLWVRNGIKLFDFERHANDFVISLCKSLKESWKLRQQRGK